MSIDRHLTPTEMAQVEAAVSDLVSIIRKARRSRRQRLRRAIQREDPCTSASESSSTDSAAA